MRLTTELRAEGLEGIAGGCEELVAAGVDERGEVWGLLTGAEDKPEVEESAVDGLAKV